MNADAVLAFLPAYGAVSLFLVAAFGCLGVPLPGSLALLAAGAFVASGDLSLAPVLLAAYAGALAGDQSGFWLGRLGGGWVEGRLSRGPSGAAAVARARALTERSGSMGVFLSRWLVAPLGPLVNLLAAGLGMTWIRFSLAGAAGEIVWVGGYVAMGFAFAGSIGAIAALLGDLSWMLAAGAVAALLGLRLRAAILSARPRPRPDA